MKTHEEKKKNNKSSLETISVQRVRSDISFALNT